MAKKRYYRPLMDDVDMTRVRRAAITILTVSLLLKVVGVHGESARPDRDDTAWRLENIAGLDADETREMLAQIKRAVRDNDGQTIAEMVDFPLVVCLDSHPALVETKKQLVARFSDIMTKRIRRAIEHETFDSLFVNYTGWMIGGGEFWIRGGMITEINNASPLSTWCDRPLRYVEPRGREIVQKANRGIVWQFLSRTGLWKVVEQYELGFSLPDADTCRLYHADVNNDGVFEYVVTYHGRGSGNYSGVHAVYGEGGNGRLVKIPFREIVVRSQCPGGAMSDFHMRLAWPFLVVKADTTYMAFRDGNIPHFYHWTADDEFRAAPHSLGLSLVDNTK